MKTTRCPCYSLHNRRFLRKGQILVEIFFVSYTLVQESFDLESPLSNTMRFVPR